MTRTLRRALADRIAAIVGSWPSLIIMAAISLAWSVFDIRVGAKWDALNLTISIWTMLLDVLVLIAANRNTWYDREMLTHILKIVKHLDGR